MAYALIQFTEAGQPKATLYRLRNGEPTGPAGTMDALSALIESTSGQMLGQGSPGALYMAQLFLAREREAGRDTRLLGGEGPLGISAAAARDLEGSGFFYEVSFGREGERSVPGVFQRAIGVSDAEG